MEDPKKEQDPKKSITEGFENFLSDLQNRVKNFQNSLLEQHRKGIERWNQNQERIKDFFQNSKKKFDNQITIWKQDFKKKQIETKEQWELTKQKISQDYQNWQEKIKKDFNSGLKKWNRFWIKGSFIFLLFMTPILIVIIIIAIAINLIQ
ncbi:MAG: hypothetical protein JXA99_13420 [Candidatus Lokiarchaeota archaeon]|nr:hypothetical protein [Candidatus Lokiarchaeota archaeon]